MPTMVSEVYDALLEAGASEGKARRAAEAVAGFDHRFSASEKEMASEISALKLEIVSRVDELRRELSELRGEVRQDIADLRSDVNREVTDLKQDNTKLRGEFALVKWMLGFLLAGVAALVAKAFFP